MKYKVKTSIPSISAVHTLNGWNFTFRYLFQMEWHGGRKTGPEAGDYEG